MASPRTISAGASRARRSATALAAALVLSCLPGLGVADRATAGEDELREAKQELRETKERVRERNHRIRRLQHQLDAVATRIVRTEAKILEAGRRIERLEREIVIRRVHAELLQAELDERNRGAYMLSGASILYLLTATSAADAAARMSFLTEMSRRDELLVAKVQAAQDRLSALQTQVARSRQFVQLWQEQLEADRRELRRKMALSQRLLEGLEAHVAEVQYEISRIRPFAVCPIDGPHAIADDFGILVHHPKKEGGDHIHQGNDIYAATGTPIVAPFDGTAVSATNKIGGLAVKVYGRYGYVYNAHLSRFGWLGPVEQGDVIGYVGATGNAGGPHDHFEWHPGNGSAVDPHGFLRLVCSGPLMTF